MRNAERTRNARNARGLFCGCAVGLLLAGCLSGPVKPIITAIDSSHSKSWNHEQWDDAVRTLEAAHENPPLFRGKTIAARLQLAKRRAAACHIGEARKCYQQCDMGKAEMHLQKALKHTPGDSEAESLLEKVTARARKAQQLIQEGKTFAAQKDWEKAVERIKAALQIDESLPGIKARLAEVKEDACAWYLAKAQAAFKQEDWKQAEKDAKDALTYNPSHAGARQLSDTARAYQQAAELTDKAKRLAEKQNYRDALTALTEAKRLHPGRTDLDALIVTAKKNLCDQLIAHGEALLDEDSHRKAVLEFRASKEVLSDYGNIDDLLREAAAPLTRKHLKTAKEFEARELPGNALVQYVIAAGYNPDSPDVREGMAKCSQELRDETKYAVGLVGFKASEGKEAGFAQRLGARVTNHLLRVKPPNVSVIDREDLEKILQEQDLSLSDLVDPRFRIERGKIRGIDAIVVGKLLECNVIQPDKSVTSYGESTYQRGRKTVPNPDYTKAKANVDNATSQLTEAERRYLLAKQVYEEAKKREASSWILIPLKAKMDSAESELNQAKDRLENARHVLSRTSQIMQVPNMLKHKYSIYTIKKQGRIVASVKVLDAMVAESLHSETIQGISNASGKYIRADPAHNVNGVDPELPDDPAMQERAFEQAAENLDACIERAIFKHGHRFLVNARSAEVSGKHEAAVENCVKYLFAYPVGVGDTAGMLIRLQKAFAGAIGSDELAGLMRAHCHVLLEPGQLPFEVREQGDKLVVTSSTGSTPTPGSVVTAIEGNVVNSLKGLNALLTHFGAGDTVTVSVLSGQRSLNLAIKLVPLSSE